MHSAELGTDTVGMKGEQYLLTLDMGSASCFVL